jgi:chromosomal replication initiator protein
MWWPYKNPSHFKELSRKHLGRLLATPSLTPSERAPDIAFPELGLESLKTLLNDKYTFESFIVGSCNQFAHAGAQAVVAKPYETYNPLFIYGAVGTGKTHLMHAIGHSLSRTIPGARIVYSSPERFMNQMINCIKQDRMQWFHNYYRTADVLLVDDIQFIAGKEGTQEEFFHTFNDLFDRQKQIVITSESPPRNIPGLVDRLRSRFEWGLQVDLQTPDLETKMSILARKAEMEGVHLPDDVCIFIATLTKSNIRELEGALVRSIAYSSVARIPINLSVAQQVLRYLMHSQSRKVTFEQIIRGVSERFSLVPEALKSKSNEKKVAYARQIAIYLAKELTGASLPEIGRVFGGKHHTTVLRSIQKIEHVRQGDMKLNGILHELLDRLG